MKKGIFLALMVLPFLFGQQPVAGQQQKLDTGWYHFRNADPREWAEFPLEVSRKLLVHFSAEPNTSEKALSLRQYDVKRNWTIVLNGESIGSLVVDEKDLRAYYKIPAGSLKAENTLEVSSSVTSPDDIRLGEIYLHDAPVDEVLSTSQLALHVFDADTRERMPARITIVDQNGTLQSVSDLNQRHQTVRPGYVYTGDGVASVGIPPGRYTLYATRGFEYGMDSTQVVLNAGDKLEHHFSVKHEVSTTGWVSSDTHIHTQTWSGHGDASTGERALTIAGEGIELPIMTDHNVQVDLRPFAIQQEVARYFTAVPGNEVTTTVGHFNVFPLTLDAEIDHGAKSWAALARDIRGNGNPKAIILNHARDIHSKFRPFDPGIHLSSAGMRLDKSQFFANAMEVINSGAQRTDQRQLIRDWFGLLNHGQIITPVGSSDSHDVSRYFVGQARTYIRSNDDDASHIDIAEAVRNFLEGNVMVSFGLLAEIEVNDTYGPGELVPDADQIKVSVRVLGPSWARADKVELYANGQKIREQSIEDEKGAGTKWEGTWQLTLPPQDMFLVALASGPDGKKPFWPIAKPYQPESPEWDPCVLGLSGAVWVDSDKNGIRNSAKDYAELVYSQAGSNLNQLIRLLASFDESVSVQAAALLHKKGKDLSGPEITEALDSASPQTQSAFQLVIKELELSKKKGGD